MQIFFDELGIDEDTIADMPITEFCERMAIFMQKVDCYKSQIELETDTFKFTIVAEEKSNIKIG